MEVTLVKTCPMNVLSLSFFALLAITFCVLCSDICQAYLVDRVVAFVDDQAITLSELNENYERTKNIQPGISKSEILNTMINRLLLLTDARNLKIEAKTDDQLLNEYIELKVKSQVRLKEEEIEDFYRKNQQEFKGVSYETVRDKIEGYLSEREINRRLKQYIAELRSKAYVKIVMEELP